MCWLQPAAEMGRKPGVPTPSIVWGDWTGTGRDDKGTRPRRERGWTFMRMGQGRGRRGAEKLRDSSAQQSRLQSFSESRKCGLSQGEAAANTDEDSLTCLWLTYCCAGWFLTGHKQVLVHGPSVGDPCCRPFLILHSPANALLEATNTSQSSLLPTHQAIVCLLSCILLLSLQELFITFRRNTIGWKGKDKCQEYYLFVLKSFPIT